MFQTTSPFDCTKYPYGCCPEDPFPNMVNGGCSPDCLCNPLGTFYFKSILNVSVANFAY